MDKQYVMYCMHWISVRFYKVLIVFSLSSALLIGGGCAGTGKKVSSIRELRDITTKGLSKYKKHTFLPGDEISISVLRNGEYNRRFIIPSDGNIFFAYIGFINIEGKSIEELTNIIAQGL